jgi:glycosyltransferase involved in cell wall biosynthesis
MGTRITVQNNTLPLLSRWMGWGQTEGEEVSTGTGRLAPTRLLSVVIPAHNEAEYLRRTLESLRRQNYGWFEVIVVANGCRDNTADIARGRCQRLIVLSQRNLGVARNLGARMAKGELLVFLDADTLLEPMALRHIAAEFSESDSAGTICGQPDSEDVRYRFVYALKNAVHRLALHPGSSGVIICWKEQFMRVGGFDEGLCVRENSHLTRRLRRLGRYKYIGEVTATTSMRRFEQVGFGRVTWLWFKVWLQSWFGDLHQRQYEPVR